MTLEKVEPNQAGFPEVSNARGGTRHASLSICAAGPYPHIISTNNLFHNPQPTMFPLSSRKAAPATLSSAVLLLALASSALAATSLSARQSNGTSSSTVDPADDIHNPLRYIAKNVYSIIALGESQIRAPTSGKDTENIDYSPRRCDCSH